MKVYINIFFLVSCLFYCGCGCSSKQQKTEEQSTVHQNTIDQDLINQTYTQNIPDNIIQKANTIIIKRTGIEFFNKYIKLNSEKSREIPEAYYLSYVFQIPGKDYIEEEISFIIDKKGSLKPGFEIAGIPNCIADTSGCRFDITREKAVEIAGQAGLQSGIKDWDASFEWDSAHGKYIWLIRSTSSESMGSNGKRGAGEKMLIDANSGEVISKTEWKVF